MYAPIVYIPKIKNQKVDQGSSAKRRGNKESTGPCKPKCTYDHDDLLVCKLTGWYIQSRSVDGAVKLDLGSWGPGPNSGVCVGSGQAAQGHGSQSNLSVHEISSSVWRPIPGSREQPAAHGWGPGKLLSLLQCPGWPQNGASACCQEEKPAMAAPLVQFTEHTHAQTWTMALEGPRHLGKGRGV